MIPARDVEHACQVIAAALEHDRERVHALIDAYPESGAALIGTAAALAIELARAVGTTPAALLDAFMIAAAAQSAEDEA